MTAADTTPEGTPVPLRQRPIPDQLDYFGEKLAAQMDSQAVSRDALIAMGAAIVGMGYIAAVLRKPAAPASAAGPDAARLAQIRDRSERLAAIPLETAASNYIMRDMIDSIGDVRWLLERVEQLERESFAAALDTGPGTWCWNRHPDHPLPCGRFAGHEGPHVRGEHRWDNEQQPEDGDRG